MKKLGKIALLLLLAATALLLTGLVIFNCITADAKLDKSKLINYGQTITIYDDSGQKIQSSSIEGNRNTVLACDLKEHTKNAFIASEDRKFYSHNGLNYGRMVKALFKNIASFSFKEGASTISQQLIKNTHLSNDKTLSRKLKEIKLTRQLERAYSKDEILEMYLNTIYFGHSCYGLQSAAKFYFDTDAENLTLTQSATLAGLLTSPNNYSPFKNPEKCLTRRNIVLNSMRECSFISDAEYKKAAEQPLGAVKGSDARGKSYYIDAMFDELEDINLDCYTQLPGCKIYTYMDSEMQKYIEQLEFESDGAVIVTGEDNGVCAYVNTINGAKRQPGSTIKPLLVYAPAIEEGLIHTFTKIEDTKINFGEYCPENYDKKYHGMVTVAQSIAQSYNIPAVKTLNALTIEKAAKYAKKLSVPIDEEDKYLSLALGGMHYGMDIKTLCDAYSTFRKSGMHTTSHFIKKIEDSDGNVIYTDKKQYTRAFSEGTCSLMNEMLIQTAKSGTAKKLKNMPFDVAAKTGTCGDDSGNTDAYATGYTSQHSICVWLGDRDNKKTGVTGGGQCCNILKDVLQELYRTSAPQPLETSSGTVEVDIDRQDYDADGKIILADDISPKLNRLSVKCLKGNEPKQKSSKFSHPTISKPTINVENGTVSIVLCQTYYYLYIIKRDAETIYDGQYTEIFKDMPQCGSHTYSITPYFLSDDKKYFGDEIILEQINIAKENSNPLPPSITQKNWYD